MREIRLVSYNLDHSNRRNKLINNVKFLATQGTDIFCFQEIRATKSEKFIGDSFLEALGPDWQGKFWVSFDSKNDYGMCILWNSAKLKLVSSQNVELPTLGKLSWDEWFVEKYFMSGEARPVKRGVIVNVFEAGGSAFRVSNIHTDWQGGFVQRQKQFEALISFLKANPIKSEIICGDFNTVGFLTDRGQVQKLQSIFGSDFKNIFPPFRFTTRHCQHLDHIFVRNFAANSSSIHKMLGSDHFPLFVSLNLGETTDERIFAALKSAVSV